MLRKTADNELSGATCACINISVQTVSILSHNRWNVYRTESCWIVDIIWYCGWSGVDMKMITCDKVIRCPEARMRKASRDHLHAVTTRRTNKAGAHELWQEKLIRCVCRPFYLQMRRTRTREFAKHSRSKKGNKATCETQKKVIHGDRMNVSYTSKKTYLSL